MKVPHDAPQVALVLSDQDDRVGLVTDLGYVPSRLHAFLSDCRAVLIESNHDRAMLDLGPYPRRLRERVAGNAGHLSNEQTAGLLRRLSRHVEQVVLMHISETNNTPERAREVALGALRRGSIDLRLAHQRRPLILEGRRAVQLRLTL